MRRGFLTMIGTRVEARPESLASAGRSGEAMLPRWAATNVNRAHIVAGIRGGAWPIVFVFIAHSFCFCLLLSLAISVLGSVLACGTPAGPVV